MNIECNRGTTGEKLEHSRDRGLCRENRNNRDALFIHYFPMNADEEVLVGYKKLKKKYYNNSFLFEFIGTRLTE